MDNLKNEAVNSPDHYNIGGIECIDAIRAALTPEEFRGFCKGNIIKYTWRERKKNGNEDIRKADKYTEYLLAAPAPIAAPDAAHDMAIAEAVWEVCAKHFSTSVDIDLAGIIASVKVPA